MSADLPMAGVAPGTRRLLSRYGAVAGVLAKYGFVDVVAALRLSRSLPLAMRLLPRRARVDPALPWTVRVRRALEDLGPTFIKFGQALSLRSDLLPPDLTVELSRLQDDAAPVAADQIVAAIEEALGQPLTQLFASFDRAPLASASIAQVHLAELLTGECVVVKVRRPDIGPVIARDLDVLRQLARLAERYLPVAAVIDPVGLVEEFARTIRAEQNLAREGRNIEHCARNFQGDPTVRFPRVYWDRTSAGVLTLERLDGRKVSALTNDGVGPAARRLVATRGADAILRQILVHGFFHADPHPGNVLVLDDLVVGFIDFGIVGRLDASLRLDLAHVVRAIWSRDVSQLATLVTQLTSPREDVNRSGLEQDLQELLDAYGDVPIGQLSMTEVLTDVLGVAARHHLRIPTNLLLLCKSLITIESVGRQLDPDFKMVEFAAPLAEELWIHEWSPESVATRTKDAMVEMAGLARALPRHLDAIGRKVRDGRLEVQFVHRNLDRFITEMDRSSNRLSVAVVVAALVIGSSVVIQAGAGASAAGYTRLGLVGFLVAGVLGMGLIVGVVRSGRL